MTNNNTTAETDDYNLAPLDRKDVLDILKTYQHEEAEYTTTTGIEVEISTEFQPKDYTVQDTLSRIEGWKAGYDCSIPLGGIEFKTSRPRLDWESAADEAQMLVDEFRRSDIAEYYTSILREWKGFSGITNPVYRQRARLEYQVWIHTLTGQWNEQCRSVPCTRENTAWLRDNYNDFTWRRNYERHPRPWELDRVLSGSTDGEEHSEGLHVHVARPWQRGTLCRLHTAVCGALWRVYQEEVSRLLPEWRRPGGPCAGWAKSYSRSKWMRESVAAKYSAVHQHPRYHTTEFRQGSLDMMCEVRDWVKMCRSISAVAERWTLEINHAGLATDVLNMGTKSFEAIIEEACPKGAPFYIPEEAVQEWYESYRLNRIGDTLPRFWALRFL